MKKLSKILLYFLLTVVVLAGIAFLYLKSSSPTYSGKLLVPALSNNADVYYDDYGVPHIYAQNETDAYMALGYVHAQDRLFQMEMMRRVGGGRLAEILGESLVETDKFFRAIGIGQTADKTMAEYYKSNSRTSTAAQAYLDGINQFIAAGNLPIEYKLLGIEAEKFEPRDMFLIAGYMSFTFAAAFRIEPVVDRIYQQFGAAYIKELGLLHGNNTQTIMNHKNPDTLFMANLSTYVSNIMDQLPVPVLTGSNSWVISAKKSSNGKVLFANDTHIAYAQPSVWFEAHLNYPGFNMYGNYLAGVPFALLGHNHHAAWGLTMLENDDMDFYREKQNPENKNQVWAINKWDDLKTRTETIKIKGADDILFEVKSSRHGPILNELLPKLNHTENPIAMWWIFNEMDSQLLDAFYTLNHSQSIQEAAKAASMIAAPGLNIMYGDANGNIAWWAAAKLVKRPEHVNPLMILDGADGKDDILGYYDFDYNPKSVNPPSGYVYSANNQPDSVNGLYYPGYYAPEFRAVEIVSHLEKDKKWTIDDLKQMQTNTFSGTHQHLAHLLVSIVNTDNLSEKEKSLLTELKNWDGEHQINHTNPTLYYKFLFKTLENTFGDEMGELFEDFVSSHTMGRTYPHIFANDSSIWWDDVITKDRESRSTIVTNSFTQAVLALEQQLGEDASLWQWGKVHTIEHVHPIGRQKPFDKIFNVGPSAVVGGNQVINNIDFIMNNSGEYPATYGPAIRILIDFADVENSISVLPSGQSGNLMSKHYKDQFEMYNNGVYRKQMMNEQEIKNLKRKLVLVNK